MSSMYPPNNNAPVPTCQRCGAALFPNELQCRNCGLFNTPPQTSNPWQIQQPQTSMPGNTNPPSSQSRSQFRGSPLGQFHQNQPAAGNFLSGTSTQSQPQQTKDPFSQGGQSNLFNAPNMVSNPANFLGIPPQEQSSYFVPSPMPQAPAPTPSPAQSDTPARRGPNIGLIIGIVALLVVITGGSFAGYLYLRGHASTNNNQTSTTPQNNPTPSTNPIFKDAFQDNTNGWDLTSKDGQFQVKIANNSLILEDDQNMLLPELVPGGKVFDNFKLLVDVSLSKGTQPNGYGVYVRMAVDQSNKIASYYRFELYGDGTFAIFKGSIDASGNTKSDMIVDFTSNQIIQKQGGVNHIAITANGSNLSFMVNGQVLHAFTDASYTSGMIALFVSNVQNEPVGAQATFTNLGIYPVSA